MINHARLDSSTRAFLIAWILVLVFFPLTRPGLLRGQQNESTNEIAPDQFLKDYQRALGSLQTTYHNVQAEGIKTFESEHVSLSQPPREPIHRKKITKFSYAFSDGHEKVWIERDEPKYLHRVMVSADGNQFRMGRRTPDAPYFLEQAGGAGELDEFGRYRNRIRDATYCPAGLPEFLTYLGSPEFQIQRVVRTAAAGEHLVKVVFDCSPSDKTKTKMKGWFSLDSSLDWVIRDYEIEVQRPGGSIPSFRLAGSVRYEEGGKQPVPVEIHVKSETGNKKTKYSTHETYTISRFSLASTPSGDFTLAAYGLGDFEKLSRRSTNRVPYYAAAFAAVALLVSFVLTRFGKRLRGRVTEAEPGRVPS